MKRKLNSIKIQTGIIANLLDTIEIGENEHYNELDEALLLKYEEVVDRINMMRDSVSEIMKIKSNKINSIAKATLFKENL